MRMPGRRWITRIGVLLLSLVVGLFICELALRILGVAERPIEFRFLGNESKDLSTVPDEELFWRLDPAAPRDIVDPVGLRGEVPSGPRHPNELRIVCVGDSCTYGFGLTWDESWPRVLERRMQADLPDMDVRSVTAAVPGYSTYQDLKLLERLGERAQGSLTILYMSAWNDAVPAAGLDDAAYGAWSRRFRDDPFLRLRIGRLVQRLMGGGPAAPETGARAPNPPLRVGPEEFARNVRSLVETGKSSGPVIGILPARASGPGRSEGLAFARRLLADLYGNLEVPTLDLEPVLARAASSAGALLVEAMFLDEVHPSGAGCEAIAQALQPLALRLCAPAIAELGARRPSPMARIAAIAPASLAHGQETTLRVTGTGFLGLGREVRIELGDRRCRDVEVLDDATVLIRLRSEEVGSPGRKILGIKTLSGFVAAPEPVTVPVHRVSFAVRESGGSLVGEVSVDADHGLLLGYWSPRLLETPVATPWGPFRLADPYGDHPAEAFRNPLAPQGLRMPIAHDHRPAPGNGGLTASVPIPEEWRAHERLYLQVLVRSGSAIPDAWMSDALTVELPSVTPAVPR